MATDRKTLFLGLGLFVFALLFRLVGIGWGLPNETQYVSLHPDEPLILGMSQTIEPAKLDFKPVAYNYGTLYLTLLKVATDVVSAYGGSPELKTPADVAIADRHSHLGGRVLSALAGAGTVWMVFLILLPQAGKLGGIAGALAMAAAPGHVVHSRFQTVDVVAAFFLAVSLYFALRLIEKPEKYLKLAALSGLFAGLSAGTKYTGILALVAVFVIAAFDRRRVAWTGLALAVGVAVVAFFVTTPGALTDSANFLKDFKFEMTHTQAGHGLVFAGTPSGFVYHFWNLFVAMGTFVVVLGVLGLLRATYKQHVWALALLGFAIVYYFLIGRAEVKFMRYVFPLVPVLAVGFGWIVARAKESPKGWIQAGVGVFAAVAVAQSLAAATGFTVWMVQDDPRTIIARDLRADAKEDSTLGLASDPWFYTPTLYPESAAGPYVPIEKRIEFMSASRKPRILRYLPADVAARIDFDKRLLTELKPDYVVVSSFEYDDLARLKELPSPPGEFSTQLGRAEEFMDILSTEYERWKVQGSDGVGLPHDLAYIRPQIWVWKRKTDSSTPSTGTSTTSVPSEGPAPTP